MNPPGVVDANYGRRELSAPRVIAVTVGLAAAGAIVGALLGGTILWTWAWIAGGFKEIPPVVNLLQAGGWFGSIAGAVMAPFFAWTLMRTVPLGRAIRGTAIGTIIGAVGGSVLPLVGTIAGGIVGFGVAAIRLRHIVRMEQLARLRSTGGAIESRPRRDSSSATHI